MGVWFLEAGLDPAFPVLLLLAKHLPHQGSFAFVVQRARRIVRLIAGVARRWCPLAHGQTLLTAGMCAQHWPHLIVQPQGGKVPLTRASGDVAATRLRPGGPLPR